MSQIQYNIHLLFTSKYKMVIYFSLLSLIYVSFYGQNISYCMTEGNDIPAIAESKPSHQVVALKREIRDFAGSQVYLLERITTAEARVIELQEFKTTTENYITELHRLNAELLEERNLNTPSYVPRCYHIGAACGACASGYVRHCVLHCCIIS